MRAVVGNILAAVFLLVLVRWLRCGDRLRMLPAAACRRGGLVILALGLLLPLAVLLALPTACFLMRLFMIQPPLPPPCQPPLPSWLSWSWYPPPPPMPMTMLGAGTYSGSGW